MSALGSLVVKLALEHAEFTKGLDKSSQEALRFAKNSQDSFNKFEQSAKSSFNSAVKSTIGLVAGLVGVTSAIGALNQSINQLAALDDLSQKTGSAVEELSRLQKVAIQFGQDFSLVEGSLTKLAKGIGDLDDEGGKANTALKALGINSRDLTGKLRDPADLMIEVAKRLQDYRDGAAKAAIANDLFGKSGVELLPYLNDLAENVDRFTGASAESAAKAAAFQDRLGSLKEQANSAFQSIASNVLPTLDAMLQKFIENAEKGNLFLGVLTSIGEVGKSALFGSDRSRQEERFKYGIPSEMIRIASQLKNENLDSTERIRLQTELQFLAKEQNALSIQLNKVQAKQESPYTNPTDKPVLDYNSGDGKAAMDAAKRAADKARQEALRAIQDEIDEETEKIDIVNEYKSKKEKDFVDYKKNLEDALNKKSEELADAAVISEGRRIQEVREKQEDAIRKVAEEQKRQFDRVAGEISLAFTNGLFDSFKNGESFGKAMVRNIVALAQTWFARMFESLLTGGGFQKLIASFGGSLSGNAVAGESSGGISGLFSSVKDIFTSTNGSIVSSIQDLGVYLSNGNGGLGDILGGFLGENASAISDGFGYLGAAFQLAQGNIGGALGTAIGTFFGGPLGGAIGSVLGSMVGGLFGGGLPPRVSESRSALSKNGTLSLSEGADPGKRKLGAGSQLDALNKAFIDNLNTLFGAFGVDDSIFANSLLTKKVNTRSRFGANIDGKFLGYDDASFGKDGTIEQAFNSLINRALGSYTVKAIQASSLPDGIKKFFDGLTKKEDVAETINTLIGMKNALVDLPPIFDAVRNAIDTTAYKTTLDQLKAQFAATQNFVNLFYSDSEKFDIFTGQLQSQLAKLNETLPSSRDEYRALVESINVVDAATRDQFNGLIALAPAMDQYFNQLQQQADGIREVNEALAEGLDKNLFSTFADYASARASVANGLSPNGFMAGANATQRDDALAEEVKVLKEQGANQQTILEAIAGYLYNMEKIYKQWNGDGLPAERVI